jgi:hypothetical protein
MRVLVNILIKIHAIREDKILQKINSRNLIFNLSSMRKAGFLTESLFMLWKARNFDIKKIRYVSGDRLIIFCF